MDLIKQYIVQSISAASNNLRLSTEKIEVVALLREKIIRSEDLENDIREMKKITVISTLAIRLNEIYNFLTQGQIDLFKFSDKFKEHSQFLIKDLSHMLDIVNPATLKKALDGLNDKSEPGIKEEIHADAERERSINDISVDLSKRKLDETSFTKPETEVIKEKLIMEDETNNEDLFFQNYEAEIIKPIKPLDNMLKQLSKNEISPEEILKFAEVMKTNGELSAKVGFEIIANMHKIIASSLLLIRSRDLMPGKEIIESIRACLIVIVAVVRSKEVDITIYLNRAEEFGRKLQTIKIKEIN